MAKKDSAQARLGNLFATMQGEPATPAKQQRKQRNTSAATTATPAVPPVPDRRSGGRRRTYTERITPITVSVAPEHVRYIDAVCNAITTSTGTPCSRGEVIRAMIDAITSSGVDLSRAAGGEEIRSILNTRLRRS